LGSASSGVLSFHLRQVYRYATLLPHMTDQIYVERNKGENTASVIRRFSRKSRGRRLLQLIRGQRYFKRQPSDYTKKKNKLTRLQKTAEYEEQAKLGRVA
jgi:hypothetical protein